MNEKNYYINQIQKQMEQYREKISKIDNLLQTYNLSGRRMALSHQRENLEGKLKQAEAIFRDLQVSSGENFEKIKEDVKNIFDDIKEAFYDFSNILAMEQIYHAKDQIISFSNEKVEEAQNLVKNHPLTMTVGAVSIGFIIGILLARSR